MKKVAIIGGGASSLIIADFLASSFDVVIYEKEKSIGRKFLVAGKGGFNLTNEAKGENLTKKYTPFNFLDNALNQFDSSKTRAWLNGLGIPTFIGSSGRIFPNKETKPIEVLEAIRTNILKKNAKILTHHTFIAFDEKQRPIIKHNDTEFSVDADVFVFALGGASWARTGSDGKWRKQFEQMGINCLPFQSSNCGIDIEWNKDFAQHHTGKPLKNITITVNNSTIKGEALITSYGLEGNAIYPSVPLIRQELNRKEIPMISIDFKPNNSLEQLQAKISKTTKTKDYEKLFNLNKVEFALLKGYTTKSEFIDPNTFTKKLKSLQIPIKGLRPIDEAISTVGGVAIESLNSDFSLKKIPNYFIAGEMINWDTPTGGYLLQGCFSIGHLVAQSILTSSSE